MTEMLKGIAASDGVAVAKAYLLVQPDLSFETVTVEDTSAEEARLDAALAASQDELSVIREKAVESLGEEAAAVFDAHLMVLADPEMTGQIKETIRAKQVNAEAALTEVTDMFIAIFEGMEDNPYMQERAADIRDVTKRVLANLLGKKLPNPATINEESIVVAHDLTPSDTAQLNKKYVKAFVTNIGGRTSHSAIMARTLEIAAVLGTNNITELVKDGDILAVSGITGEVVINPTEEQIAEFKAAGEAYAKQKAEWALLKDAQTVTADGKHFELAANIGTPKDVEGVNDNGAEAVGLYRTEFLYMDSQDFPTEDDQYEAYKAVLEGMNGKPVVVRTMDIGGDKELPYFDLPKEMNPFLGYRALRISICETGNQMFRTQLRALLRASVHGKLRIMFPMVALLTEFRTAKGILEEEKANGTDIEDAAIQGVKIGMMGPLAGIGDPVFWFTVRPILGALGASLAQAGNIAGPLIFFIGWNLIRMAFLWYTQELGYKAGSEITKDMSGGILKDITKGASILGMFILAVLVERWVSIVFTVNLPGKVLSKGAYIEWPKGNVSGDQLKTILGQVNDKLSFDKIQVDTLQKQLDSLIPGLMGLLLTFACMWLLKKKVSPITIIIGLFVVGIVASFFGIM